MPRGVTLGELITQLRHETNHSADPALGVQSRDKLAHSLRRVQNSLWLKYDWQHLKVTRFVTMADGQRVYDFPSDLAPERLDLVQYREEAKSRWVNVDRYITTEQLDDVDSAIDKREDGVKRWDLSDDGKQFEVWPIPDTNGTNTSSEQSYIMRFHGVRNLNALIENDDTCDLDSDLLALRAASVLLASSDPDGARERIAAADGILKDLRAHSGQRRARGFSMNQGWEDKRRSRPHVVRVDD